MGPPTRSAIQTPGVGRCLDMQENTRQIALVAVLAATYALTSYFPISVYIGGEALITVNIIILPLLAYLLDSKYAITAALIGGLAMYFTSTAIAPVYGYFTLFIPVGGVLLGALTKKNCVASLPWIMFGAILYAVYSGGTFLWLALYGVAAIFNFATLKFKQLRTVNICISTTISELILMDIGSIFLLEFPGPLWIIILPFAVYERIVAVLGSIALINGLTRYGSIRIEKE